MVSAIETHTPDLESLRSWVAHQHLTGEFSGVCLLGRRGQPLFEQAVGLADHEHEVANTIDTRFNLGSINKTFTAIAIAQLVEAKLLDFHATVSTYLPDYRNPNAAGEITIHQLLTHTAGLPPYMSPEYMREREQIDTLDGLVRVFASKPLEFEPGSRQKYCNSGFVLLGHIIERVSGTTYDQYVKTGIYDPAGMYHTGFGDDGPLQSARGYFSLKGDRDRIHEVSPGQQHDLQPNTTLLDKGNPAGGGYSTAKDLLSFSEALRTSKLLGPAMTDHTLNRTFSGEQLPKYGYGLREQIVVGRRFVGNGGGAPGINSEFRFEPSGEYSAIVLSNLSPPSATSVLERALTVLG